MEKLFSVLLAAMLIFGLTACGATDTTSAGDNDILGDETIVDDAGDTLFGGDSTDSVRDNSGGDGRDDMTGDAGRKSYATGNDAKNGRAANGGNNGSDNQSMSGNGNSGKNGTASGKSGTAKGGDTGVGTYDSRNPANGTAQFDGASYGQMLANGRVHDSDGDLKDHENASF